MLAGLRDKKMGGRKIEGEFEFKEGWYEIRVPGDFTSKQAAELHRFAITIANTNLKPMHLGSFKQCP